MSGNEVRMYPGPWWKVRMRMLARTFKRILLSVIKGVCVFSRVMWYDDHHVTSPSSMRRGAAELSEDMGRSRKLVRPASPVEVTVRHPPLGWPS